MEIEVGLPHGHRTDGDAVIDLEGFLLEGIEPQAAGELTD